MRFSIFFLSHDVNKIIVLSHIPPKHPLTSQYVYVYTFIYGNDTFKRSNITAMDRVDFVKFYKDFILFTDRVIPTLKPIEQPILLQIFSRTVGMGKTTCQISYDDFQDLTDQSLPTIKKALRSLLERGLIRLANVARARIAKTYEFIWPEDVRHLGKLERDPEALLREMLLGSQQRSFLDELTPRTRTCWKFLYRTSPREDEAHYKEMARAVTKPTDNPAKYF